MDMGFNPGTILIHGITGEKLTDIPISKFFFAALGNKQSAHQNVPSGQTAPSEGVGSLPQQYCFYRGTQGTVEKKTISECDCRPD